MDSFLKLGIPEIKKYTFNLIECLFEAFKDDSKQLKVVFSKLSTTFIANSLLEEINVKTDFYLMEKSFGILQKLIKVPEFFTVFRKLDGVTALIMFH